MKLHRYTLEPYKTMKNRYHCPNCNNRVKTFVRYIDTQTGEYLADDVGRCNRESQCGYHYTPKQYFQKHKTYTEQNYSSTFTKKSLKPQAILVRKPKESSLIPVQVFEGSLKNYEINGFAGFLTNRFGVEIANQLISRYLIGTSKHWGGATVFWQIDGRGNVRTGKIMLYSPVTGKRSKEPYHHPNWVHSVLKLHEFNLQQCLFGEHLLSQPENKYKPIGVVESEKTAVIASIYIPQLIWVAVGSLTSLNAEKCSVLKGRNVTLFPDLNGFDKWSSKAKELSHITRFTVSSLLERKATAQERKQGLDLADYLIRFNYKEFISAESLSLTEVQTSKPLTYDKNDWSYITDDEIAELEHFINAIKKRGLPRSFHLDEQMEIKDVAGFLLTRLEIIKSRKEFQPALHELIKFISLN